MKNLSTFKKLPKRMLFVLSALVVAGAFIAGYLYFFSKPAVAAWMDENWLYRKAIAITNAGTAQTDFQISCTLDTATLISAGKMKSDCSDVRATDINGKLLPHWINTCNNAATEVWTKVPSIPTSGQTIYVYYGNPSAPGTQNGRNVFLFFDDFTDSSLQRWQLQGSNYAVSGGALVHSSGDNEVALSSYSNNDFVMEGKAKTSAAGSQYVFLLGRKNASLSDDGSNIASGLGGNGGLYAVWKGDGWATSGSANDIQANTWYALKVIHNGANVTLYGDAGAVSASTSRVTTATASVTSGINIGVLGNTTASQSFDDIRIRKFASTEPTTSPATEENGPGPVGYWKFDEGGGYAAKNTAWHKTGTTANLIVNPSFETNTTSWQQFGGGTATISQVTSSAVFGSASLQAVMSGAGVSPSIGIDPGTTNGVTYTISFFAKSVSGNTALHSELWGAGGSTDVTLTTNWQKFTYTGAASSTSRLYLWLGGAGTFLLDGVQVEAVSAVTPYCDGSLTGNGQHAWSGTAHASTSTCDYGNDGQIIGASWQKEDLCVSGKCLYLDGTDDQVSVADTTSLSGLTKLSFEAWGRTSSSNAEMMLITKDDTSGQREWQFKLYNQKLYLALISGNNWNNRLYVYTTNGGWNDGKWHHYAATWSGSTDTSGIKLYIDGVQQSVTDSSAGTFTAMSDTTATTDIGTYSNHSSSPFQGFIDEPKIYPYARTAAQVKTDYLAGKANASAHSGTSAVLGSQPQDWLSNGLVGYWKMDEASANSCSGGVNDSCDASGNGNDGAWNGDATSGAGKFGNAVSLDGTGDYVDAGDPSNGSLDFGTGSFSFAGWVKSSDAYGIILSKYTGGAGYDLRIEGGALYAFMDGSSSAGVGGTNIADNAWHHFVTVFDRSGNLTVYVDGKQSGSVENITAISSSESNSDPFRIGLRSNGIGPLGPAQIDEVRVYNRALSPTEVSNLYNWAPGPVGYWDFEEGMGTTANDTSGNANAGTLTNGPAWAGGKYGKAVKFDGSNDRIDRTSTSSLNTFSQITLEAWVKPSAASGDEPAIAKEGTGGVQEYVLGINNSKFGCLLGDNWPLNSRDTGGSQDIQNNVWQHIACTWDGTTVTDYLNGVLVQTTSWSGTIPAGSSTFSIGANSDANSTWLEGSIDEVKIYNYARTQKQLISDINGGHPAVGSPVGSAIGHWKFNEGNGQTANNSGSQGSTLNGTLGANSGSSTDDPTWSQSGKFGRALSFDGTSDYVYLPDSDNFNFGTSDFAISLWFYNTGTTVNYPALISTYGGWSSGSFGIRHDDVSAGAGKVTVHWNPVGDPFITSTNTFDDNTWNQVSLVRSGTSFTLYVNGKVEGTGTSATAIDLAYGGSAAIGRGQWDGANGYWKGLIDEVKIYNYALTADEVKLDYNQGKSLVLGATGSNSSYAAGAANQEYCVPGDSASCAAPVGQWDFNEGKDNTCSGGTNDVCDKSGNGNDGAWNGSGTQPWAPGKVGWAGKFDGSDDYVNVPHNSSLNVAGTFTYEMWVKRNGGFGTDQRLFAKDTGSPMIDFFTANEVRVGGACTAGVATGPAISDTGWHHIAWTRNGSGNGTLYIDGVQVTLTGSFTAPTNTSSALTLGQSTCDGGMWFNGQLDGVKIFNYARSAAQVAYDYNRGAPVGWWKFDECQGSVAHDSTLNANHGTITIGASGSQASLGTCTANAATAWYNGRTGKYNSSLNFDGTDDYVDGTSIFGDVDFRNQKFTISAWTYITADNYNPIVTLGAATASNFLVNFVSQDKNGLQVFLHRSDGSSTDRVGIANTSLPSLLNGWHHVTVTHNGGTVSTTNTLLYLDGKQLSTATTVGSWGAYQNNKFLIGKTGDGSTMDGQIDDVRIFNYALTPTQVKLLYNNNFAAYFAPSTGAP